MKIRNDFITNSSSSSFIISKDDISYDKLLEILIKMAVIEECVDESYTKDDVTDNCVGDRYEIREATADCPLNEMGLPCSYFDNIYTNHYIIKNDGCRFDTDIVIDVLDEHEIPWEFGYCD